MWYSDCRSRRWLPRFRTTCRRSRRWRSRPWLLWITMLRCRSGRCRYRSCSGRILACSCSHLDAWSRVNWSWSSGRWCRYWRWQWCWYRGWVAAVFWWRWRWVDSICMWLRPGLCCNFGWCWWAWWEHSSGCGWWRWVVGGGVLVLWVCGIGVLACDITSNYDHSVVRCNDKILNMFL